MVFSLQCESAKTSRERSEKYGGERKMRFCAFANCQRRETRTVAWKEGQCRPGKEMLFFGKDMLLCPKILLRKPGIQPCESRTDCTVRTTVIKD
jgi:hypothetical protein